MARRFAHNVSAVIPNDRLQFPETEVARMKVVRKLALGLLLAGALGWVAMSTPPQVVAQSQPGQQHVWYYDVSKAGANPHQLQSESAQLAHQYVEAKKEDEKREIRKHLTEVLNQQFDLHIKQQQKELDDLEKQIAKLKDVVRKRLDAKSTIIERRLEQVIQDAEGLGWNAPGGQHPIYQSVPLLTGPSAKK
jgi:hypothetical protein